MNDSELRALVREAIARRMPPEAARRGPGEPSPWHFHVSHGLLPLARGAEGDGACLIEPAVSCTHCGYCISYGH